MLPAEQRDGNGWEKDKKGASAENCAKEICSLNEVAAVTGESSLLLRRQNEQPATLAASL